jgi:FkbM family methyltransferase
MEKLRWSDQSVREMKARPMPMTARAEPMREQIRLPDGTPWFCPARADAMMIWREIFVNGSYREAACRVPPAGTIIDVGAHSGLATLYFSRFIDHARILAFEPAAQLYQCLVMNIRQHVTGAKAYKYALGSAQGTRVFTYYPSSPSQSGLYADADKDRRATMAYLANNGITGEDAGNLTSGIHIPQPELVYASTLSAVISERDLDAIDLLKIDVERAELDVLLGIADKDWPRIESVVMEAHDDGHQLDRCVALLKTRGYSVGVDQAPWLANSGLFNVTAKR